MLYMDFRDIYVHKLFVQIMFCGRSAYAFPQYIFYNEIMLRLWLNHRNAICVFNVA